MKKLLFALGAATVLLTAGVVKVQFTENGFFVTGGSKMTGNGSSYTVCDYFDAETGAFIAQKEFPGQFFENEADLQGFCTENEPLAQ